MTPATAAPLRSPASADVPIPATHADLFGRAICGVLTTIGPGGQPESSLVWVDLDGGCPRVNTTLERRKGRNVQRDPRVSLLVVDPENTARFIQVRGVVELRHGGSARSPRRSHPRVHRSGATTTAGSTQPLRRRTRPGPSAASTRDG